MLRLKRGEVKQGASPRKDALARRVVGSELAADEARLALRLHFLCRRFRPETMRWQFVVATRQTALTLVAFFGQLCSDGSAYSEGSAAARALVWAQAGSALLVLLVALGAHFRAQPFRYRFQNQLEGGLFASDALLISSCLCYTVRRRSAHDAPVTAR